jgi:Mg/Co/Ni transporter MgtE
METEFASIHPSTPLAEIFRKIENTTESYFIVIDDSQHLSGVISFQDIRSVLSQHSLDYLVIAQDLVNNNTIVLNFDDNLETALQKFNKVDLRLIPVVNTYESDKVIGIIRRDTLIDYYNKQLLDTLRK